MPTDPPDPDLEDVVRHALRGDEIAASDLHRPTLGDRTRRPRVATQALAGAAAAAVVAIAVVVSLVASGHHGGGRSTAGKASALAGVIGYRWDVTRVHDQAGEVSVPASLGAEIGFTRDGYLLGDDGVNRLQARYRTTSDGYRVSDVESTLAVAAGGTTGRRIADVIDAMFGSGRSAGATRASVNVTISSDVLTLQRGATTLTLTRAGAEHGAALAGTIAGRLVEVGGPDGVLPRGLHGKVTITNDGTHQHRSVTVGRSGRFSVTVPSGDYTLLGHSPQYRIDSTEGVCAGDIHVTPGQTNSVKVVCPVR